MSVASAKNQLPERLEPGLIEEEIKLEVARGSFVDAHAAPRFAIEPGGDRRVFRPRRLEPARNPRHALLRQQALEALAKGLALLREGQGGGHGQSILRYTCSAAVAQAIARSLVDREESPGSTGQDAG